MLRFLIIFPLLFSCAHVETKAISKQEKDIEKCFDMCDALTERCFGDKRTNSWCCQDYAECIYSCEKNL